MDLFGVLLALCMDIANGGGRTFRIPAGLGWSDLDAKRLLRKRGIKTWGHMIINNQYLLTVPKDKGKLAEEILQEAGVPIGAKREK